MTKVCVHPAALLMRLSLLLGLALPACGLMDRAQAAELIMFERAGCYWCARWNREVGPVYDKTPEGRKAPLRRVDLDKGQPTDLKLDPAVYFTPTFVVMDKGREVARILGYSSDMMFWGLLGKHLAALPSDPVTPPVQ
jgi:hypothetical protein